MWRIIQSMPLRINSNYIWEFAANDKGIQFDYNELVLVILYFQLNAKLTEDFFYGMIVQLQIQNTLKLTSWPQSNFCCD